jgi:hypothetical protein
VKNEGRHESDVSSWRRMFRVQGDHYAMET